MLQTEIIFIHFYSYLNNMLSRMELVFIMKQEKLYLISALSLSNDVT